MKKFLFAVVLALGVSGCASQENVRVLNSNPPFCQDYVLTDPVTGESWLCYNPAAGSPIRIKMVEKK